MSEFGYQNTGPGVWFHEASAVCSLGADRKSIEKGLFDDARSPLITTGQFSNGHPLPLGLVTVDLPTIEDQLFDTRNNRLLLLALEQLPLQKLFNEVPKSRIGVVIGSSTSGILEGEEAIFASEQRGKIDPQFDYRKQEIGAPSEFMKSVLGITGPCWTISTACTSGAKAITAAARLLKSNLCDAVVCGGVDSLCRLTVQGFSALSAVSSEVCRPFGKNRNGINVGEASALFILRKERADVAFVGSGETSDAYHISAPHPKGVGAIAAMQLALRESGRKPEQIDYINLHGTATEQNDRMEAIAVSEVFGRATACSSTKSLTGHTLGAAGALEAYFCWLTLKKATGELPNIPYLDVYDDRVPVLEGYSRNKLIIAPKLIMSNSFAFGGSNTSLIMELVNE